MLVGDSFLLSIMFFNAIFGYCDVQNSWQINFLVCFFFHLRYFYHGRVVFRLSSPQLSDFSVLQSFLLIFPQILFAHFEREYTKKNYFKQNTPQVHSQFGVAVKPQHFRRFIVGFLAKTLNSITFFFGLLRKINTKNPRCTIF